MEACPAAVGIDRAPWPLAHLPSQVNTFFCVRQILNFQDFYFRVLNLLAKSANFYTLRKYPAIRYCFLPSLQSEHVAGIARFWFRNIAIPILGFYRDYALNDIIAQPYTTSRITLLIYYSQKYTGIMVPLLTMMHYITAHPDSVHDTYITPTCLSPSLVPRRWEKYA